MEQLRLEGTSGGHQGPMTCSRQGQPKSPIRLIRLMASHALNTSMDGHPTTSLGNLYQCLTTFIMKRDLLALPQLRPNYHFWIHTTNTEIWGFLKVLYQQPRSFDALHFHKIWHFYISSSSTLKLNIKRTRNRFLQTCSRISLLFYIPWTL